MRSFVVALALLIAAPFEATIPASAAMPAPSPLVKTVVAAASPLAPVCSGCGCRGGAGYRLPSGKCAPRGR